MNAVPVSRPAPRIRVVRPGWHRQGRVAAAVTLAVLLGACGGAGTSAPPSAAPSPAASRPSSPATVSIAQPASGAILHGTSVHVVLSLKGGTIVPATTTDIRPDQGHVHLYVDNVLVSMNYGVEQDIPTHPGTYVLKAEFVAADHAPFNPRVWSPEVFFTVK
jgi:hypothetical protein